MSEDYKKRFEIEKYLIGMFTGALLAYAIMLPAERAEENIRRQIHKEGEAIRSQMIDMNDKNMDGLEKGINDMLGRYGVKPIEIKKKHDNKEYSDGEGCER